MDSAVDLILRVQTLHGIGRLDHLLVHWDDDNLQLSNRRALKRIMYDEMGDRVFNLMRRL